MSHRHSFLFLFRSMPGQAPLSQNSRPIKVFELQERAQMFSGTAILLFAKRNHPANRKAPPFHTPTQASEAQRLSIILLSLLRTHGPLPLATCWSHVQDTGFRSKRHMKLVLNWMKERQQVKVICKHLPELAGLHGDKEFFYAASASNKQV